MRADGGEAVEVRKHEGLAEGTNEEDGRHGLRGCSEVGELVRMRSRGGRPRLRGMEVPLVPSGVVEEAAAMAPAVRR